MKNKKVIISIDQGRLRLDDEIFDHDELLRAKLYLKTSGADEALFISEEDDDRYELEEIVGKMLEYSPEAMDSNLQSFYLN